MQTLDLECPSCSEMLELDAGFAGGVCRCSNCGTLMTVPSDAGQAERLSSPDPGMSSAVDRSATSRSRPSSKRKKKGSKAPSSVTVEAGEYRTETGKVVRIEKPMRVPMAGSKRKQVRMATAAVFFAIILAVVGVAAFAIISITSGDDPKNGTAEGGENAPPPPPEFVEGANPYQLDFTNVAGIPVSGKVLLIVEASSDSSRWMSDVADMIGTGLTTDGGGTVEIAMAGATGKETGPVRYNGGDAKATAALDKADIADWFTELPTKDSPRVIDFAWASGLALEDVTPDTVVYLAGSINMEQIERLEKRFEEEDVRVHVVLVNGIASRAMKGWLRDREGSELVRLNSQEIEDWKRESKD